MESNPVEQDTQEEELAMQLAIERELSFGQEILQWLHSAKEKGKSFGHPSYLKYAALLYLALIIDCMGLVELTGILWIFAKLVVIGCFVASLIISWATGSKHKEAKEYLSQLEDRIKEVGAVSKFTIKKVGSFIGHHPQILLAIGEGLDVVLPPILSVLNLSVFWVVVMYWFESRAYKHAASAADMISENESDFMQ